MLWQILVIIGGCGVFGIALWLASKNGSKSAQLEALKAEIKKQAEERYYAEKIKNNVRNLSDYDVRERLRQIADNK